MATAQEQEALNEVMQLLEATPDTAEPTGIVNLSRYKRRILAHFNLPYF